MTNGMTENDGSMVYGYCRDGARRIHEYDTLKDCLRFARRTVLAGRGSMKVVGVYRYPRGKATEIYDSKRMAVAEGADAYLVGTVWCSDAYEPQYQPVESDGHSYDLAFNGTKGRIGWRAPEPRMASGDC